MNIKKAIFNLENKELNFEEMMYYKSYILIFMVKLQSRANYGDNDLTRGLRFKLLSTSDYLYNLNRDILENK